MEVNTTDQDEIEQIKRWWSENGTSLIIGISVGLALLMGWKGWNNYIDSQGMAASQYFEQMQGALIQNDNEKAATIGDQLLDQYPSTIYAANGALGLAAMKVTQNDGAAARVHFQWVLEHSDFESPRQLARLGLARSYLNEGDTAQALAQLKQLEHSIYSSHVAEVKGDILGKQGDQDGAQLAYAEALARMDGSDDRRELLEIKLAEVTP